MSQKPKRKEKNQSQKSSLARNKKKLVDIKSKLPQQANQTVNQSIKNMSFLSPQLQKTLNAIMIDDGMNMSLQQSPFQSPHNLVQMIASSPSKLSKAKDRFLLKAQQRFHKESSATKAENFESPQQYESNNSRKSSTRQIYAGKFTPTSPRSQQSRSNKNSPRNDMKSSSFSKSNKKAKPGRVQNSSKQLVTAKVMRSNASRDSSANLKRNSYPRKSLQKSNNQIYDSSTINPFISSKLKSSNDQDIGDDDAYEFDQDPLKGQLESDQNNVFSYVKIQNMESLRHKPAAEPKNFKQAKEAVRECKDEQKLRAQHGPKYAQAKVTTWKGQHAGSVSQIVKSGPLIRYNQDMSVSLSNQLDPKALTALGAMNSLFGRKSSTKKQSQSLYMQNNNCLNISAGINDSHTPSWRQQQDVKVSFNQPSRLQQSPPLRSYSVQLAQKSKNKKKHLQQSMDSGLKMSTSNSLISSFQRKPFPGGGGGAHPRLSKSGSTGLMGGRNLSNNVSNIMNASTLPPGVGAVLTASVKKYNKKNARSLMNLFNSILSMLDPNFDETQVYRTIRILKQLCQRNYVSEEQLQDIQRQFQAISPPPQNDKKHFEIYQFVSCVIRHFQQKLCQYEEDISRDQYQDRDYEQEDQRYYESSSSSKRRYDQHQQMINNSNRDGYLSDFTPRNTQYDLQVMQTLAGRVQPPSNQIQETIAKKYNIPTLSLPLKNNSINNTKSSGAVVANPKFVQQLQPEEFDQQQQQIKYHDEDIIKYNSIPLTRSPSARAKLITDKQQLDQQQHQLQQQQSSVFSPSAAIVMNNSGIIGGKKFQHQVNSPLKQKKKQNINKAINIVMKENIKSLKKFFNRIDKLTQQSVSRGIQQQQQQKQDQSRSFSIADNLNANDYYQSNDITRTPAKNTSTSSNRKYKSAIKSSALLMNSSNRKQQYDDKRLRSMGKRNNSKSSNSIGGGSKANNNSISFNTSSFLSPGNSNGPISSAAAINSSFLKSGYKSRSSIQQSSSQSQQQQQQQQSHFSIRQQQQHQSVIHKKDDLNVSAAATIARHIANLSEAKKIPKKDPHHGPDTLIKNQVVLYPFAQTQDKKKQLVVKVKERPSSPTKRLINLKNARVDASKHLNRLGSAHSYNLCVMSKDRDDDDQDREIQQSQTNSRYESIVKQAAKTFTSPSRNSRAMMVGEDSSDSDLQRANPADQVHYQADEDIPPEPQKRAPSATKAQPKKQLHHQSFKNSTPKALKNSTQQQNESKATPFEYSDSKATGSTPPSQKNPISSASGKKNMYSASSSHYLQSSSPKREVQAAYVSFGDSEQVKSSASTKKGIDFDQKNYETVNKNATKKVSKKAARNSTAMTKSKTVMGNTAKPLTIGKQFSKQMKQSITIQEQKRKASPSPAMMVKNSRKLFGDTIKSKNYLSNSLQRDKERLERSCRFLLSKLAGKSDISLNKSKS